MGLIINYYKKLLVHRYDDNHVMHYFSLIDFPGLKADPVSFVGPHGEKMNGFYYYHDRPKAGKLVVFCHGLGPGQMAYMTEIETLAKQGYKVLAVDNVGCALSEGKDIRSMAESLADLDAVLNQLHSKDEITLIGHSWGGYAVSNIRNYHPEIKKVVVFSGFVSVENLLKQSLHGLGRIAIPVVMRFERKMNPLYADSSALSAFSGEDFDALWFHSVDDYMVSFQYSFAVMEERIHSPRLTFVRFEDHKHNSNYTADAANYLLACWTTYQKEYAKKPMAEKQAYMATIDWKRMTAQDMGVWNQVFDLIEK